ncbi:hypothetical protein M885DRAFT_435407, partial [Pelagophyceae sp. CCMP2097]
AHQNVSISDVVRQAEHLRLPLIGVPLDKSEGSSYVDRLQTALLLLKGADIESVVFGDLHLESIRNWREVHVGPQLGCLLEYPLWQNDYQDLVSDLDRSEVPCRISAVEAAVAGVEVGMLFDADLRRCAVASGFDEFGEKGEFHSLAHVWDAPRNRALGLAESTT